MLALNAKRISAVAVTAFLFIMLFNPIVEAGPDRYIVVTQETKVYNKHTGELCYTDSRTWPPRPDRNSTHYREFHKNKTTNHTHIYQTIHITHHYTDYIDECPEP